jgi:Secretion system C-terminal sorting domain
MRKKLYLLLLIFAVLVNGLWAQSDPCSAQWLPSQGSVTAKNLLYDGTFVGKYKSTNCNASEENARWYKFVPTTNVINFTVNTTNCNNVGSNGLSYALFEQRTPNCIDLKSTSNCIKQQNNAGNDALTASVLAGKLYFLQVDGLSGAQCDFTISYPKTEINSQFATVKGRAIWDFNADCKVDATDPVFQDAYVIFKRSASDSTLVAVDKNGSFETSLALANYTTYAVVRGERRLWQFCQKSINLNIDKADVIYNQDFLLQKTKDCAIMEAVIATKGFVSDEKTYLNVSYKNIGTVKMSNAKAKLTLSPSLVLMSVSQPFAKYDNVIFVNVGDVQPQQSGSFQVTVKTPATLQDKQALVNIIEMIPNNICFDNPLWNGANIRLSATCDKDTVRFGAKNVGALAAKVDGIIIEDIVMLNKYDNSTTINPNDSVTLIKIPANGKTYRLETNQAANFPLRSMPTVSVEGCRAKGSTAPFSVGFLNQLPQDDADFATEISVEEGKVNMSNINLTATPKGYDKLQYIAQNQDVKYQLRVRNPYPQTVNNIVMLSTLNDNFDMTTLQVLGSNYPFRYEVLDNTVQFIFSDINLYSVIANKDSSDIFVEYRIGQRKDVPLNNELINSTIVISEDDILNDIYLYKHRVGKNFVKISVNSQEIVQPNVKVTIAPNPFVSQAVVTVNGLDKIEKMTLQLFDNQGRMIEKITNDAQNNFTIIKDNMASGFYFFVIENDKKEKIATGKLIAE